MPTQPHKHIFLWIFLTIVAIIMAGLLVAPAFMNLNKVRGRLETAIATQTGMDVEINGDITFGIVGKTTILANDVYKNNVMESFKKILTFENSISTNLNECDLCGEPTSSHVCKACELKELISQNCEGHIHNE